VFTLVVNGKEYKYATKSEAQKVADRLIEGFRTTQRKFGNHIQVLDYIAIDKVNDPGNFLFYFDGRKLK
jgi:hypothetical protein